MNYDIVILYSGGADSRLMLEFAQDMNLKPYCILIDYEQIHIEELEFAKEQLEKEGVDYQVVKISGLNINSGLTGDGIQNDTSKVHSHHVPGRNTMFLSIGFSIAENKDINTIWFGGNWNDRLNLFPDCYQGFVVAINEVFKVAGPKQIKVEAPLSGLSKENILKLLKHNGVKNNEIYSGYGEFS